MTIMKQPQEGEFQEGGNANININPQVVAEDDYKNLQSFATKARQSELALAKKLAEKDPGELLNFDTDLQSKIIKDMFGCSNIEELRYLQPELFDSPQEEKTDIEKIRKEQALLKHKLESKELNDEYDKYVLANKKVVDATPNFREKLFSELNNISSTLPTAERIKRAGKYVSPSVDIDIEAMLRLQGGGGVIPSKVEGTATIADRTNELRKALGMKLK